MPDEHQKPADDRAESSSGILAGAFTQPQQQHTPVAELETDRHAQQRALADALRTTKITEEKTP